MVHARFDVDIDPYYLVKAICKRTKKPHPDWGAAFCGLYSLGFYFSFAYATTIRRWGSVPVEKVVTSG